MKKRFAVLPLAAAVGLVLAMAPAAFAAPVVPDITCGQAITASITLNTNLSCPGTVFDLDNSIPVTVDLGGHTVTSALTGGPAIAITGAQSQTIQNGTLRHVEVVVDDSFDSNLVNVTFDGPTAGYGGDNDFDTTVFNGTFINGASAGGDQAVDDTIESSRFVNGPANGRPAMDFFQSNTKVDDTTVTGYSTGIDYNDNRSEALVFRSTITGVHGDGIVIGGTTDSQVVGFIQFNTITHNAGDGIALEDGAGIRGDGTTTGPANLIVSGNTIANNSFDGIHVDPATHGLIADGLDVNINTNTANNNGNLGIEGVKSNPAAFITVVDGGGNTAKGNGQKVQCKVITCAK